MSEYWCGLSPVDAPYYPLPPYRGREFTIDYGLTPDDFPVKSEMPDASGKFVAKHIVIKAASQLRAQYASDLIRSCSTVIQASPALDPSRGVVFTEEEWVHNRTDPEWRTQISFAATSGLPASCILAAKASHCLKVVYAICKLHESYSLYSNSPIDLDPSHSWPNLPRSPFPSDHVKFAFAIILAYSSIEDLELNIPSGKQSRRDGQWNPEVLKTMLVKLKRAHIGNDVEVVWNCRGRSTKLDRKRPTKSKEIPSWNRYGVNDQIVNVLDAIADVSYLRSKIAAHTNIPLVRLLSPYDVANAQDLARILILHRYGIPKLFPLAARMMYDQECSAP
jgi:hypothetical protein